MPEVLVEGKRYRIDDGNPRMIRAFRPGKGNWEPGIAYKEYQFNSSYAGAGVVVVSEFTWPKAPENAKARQVSRVNQPIGWFLADRLLREQRKPDYGKAMREGMASAEEHAQRQRDKQRGLSQPEMDWLTQAFDRDLKKEEEPQMSSSMYGLQSGDRIRADTDIRTKHHPKGASIRGTFVETSGKVHRKGYHLICMDVGDLELTASAGNHVAEQLCGKRHGLWVRTDRVRPASHQGDLHNIPPHIGMAPTSAFNCEYVKFPRRAVGRVIKRGRGSKTVTIAWHNFQNRHMRNVKDSQGISWANGYSVPYGRLEWCHFANQVTGNKILKRWSWGLAAPKEPLGEFLIFVGDKPHALATDDQNYRYHVTKGVIVQNLGGDGDGCHSCKVVSGVPAIARGRTLRLRARDLTNLEPPFLPTGQVVEVVAEIVFKKADLRGKQGKVVLATDADGDIGIEFLEDLRAGCLDGEGKQGHCLYMPASAVKKIPG